MKAKQAVASALMSTILLTLSCGGPRRVDPFDTTASTQPLAPWDMIEDSDYRGDEPPQLAYDDAEEDWGAEDAYADTTTPEPETRPEPEQAVKPIDIAELPEVKIEPIPAERMSRYNRIGRLREVFNDSNKYQYAAAEKIGIRPVHSLADAYYINRPMVSIESCRWYDVDTLKHSMPYLVPEAASLLETIGRNFADSLKSRNASGHKFRVTSLLRTSHSVKRLRRVNRNATDSSTHKFGTTFDISYAHFNHDGSGRQISDEELKYILAEVLRDLRLQNRCLVKYERHTPCFHITATGH